MTVIYLPETEQYLLELIEVLYFEDYFAFPENAVEYVQNIRRYIEKTLQHSQVQREVPRYFERYGKNMNYITYKASRKTHWYIFYQQLENIKLICYITNNHLAAHY